MNADPSRDGVLGVDVGGTFTDLVHWDGAQLVVGKISTSVDQSRAVIQGADELPGAQNEAFLHGTTVATNALLEHTGVATAFVTTEGFSDIIEIARQDRPALYDPFARRAEPLAAPHMRVEVARQGPPQLDVSGIASAEAVAVSLLYGYSESDREQAIGRQVADAMPGVDVSLSSKVAPEFREFERASTTLLNAYLSPPTSRYLRSLADAAIATGRFRDLAVMRSSGGLMTLDAAAELPAAILLSGPAAGVVAAAGIGASLGKDRIVSFDMGGTSTDVCRVENGRPEVVYGRSIGGYPCLMPSVAIHTVGAGGGSIGWVDSGGSLRVGPMSAGAHPGPAGYGRGGQEPTVTDANIVLGRIDPHAQLAGRLPLQAQLTHTAVRAVGETIGLDEAECAAGIIEVIEEVMAGALRKVSVEEGADPRDAWLLAFGGAGALHGASLARRLDMAGVIVPPYAGVLSALGLLMSPPRVDVSRTVMLLRRDDAALDAATAELRGAAAAQLSATVGAGSVVEVSSVVDVRYSGQSHELSVAYRPGEGWATVVHRFGELHREYNGFSRPDDPVEVVTVRAEAVGRPALTIDELASPDPVGEPLAGKRQIVASSGVVEAAVLRRGGLTSGSEWRGPVVIQENQATTYVDEGEVVKVLDNGALEITW